MPLVKVENINTTSCWALWHISESIEKLIELSHSRDVETFYQEKIKHPVKQMEWLAARLILKFIAEKRGARYHGSHKNIYGKPYLIDSDMYVSITNSYPFAAGIICNKAPVGIDLEYPKEKLLPLAPKFLNGEELKYVNDDITKLCIYWCAKEAMFKVYGRNKISLKENIFIDPFHFTKTGTIQGTIRTENKVLKYDICYNVTDTYIVCFNFN